MYLPMTTRSSPMTRAAIRVVLSTDRPLISRLRFIATTRGGCSPPQLPARPLCLAAVLATYVKHHTARCPGERVYYELCQNITLCSVLLKNRKRGEIYAVVTIYCRSQWHARHDFVPDCRTRHP